MKTPGLRNRRVKFERHPSRIVFDPELASYVVTWSTCSHSESQRLSAAKPLDRWMPSISAICTLFDRGCISHDRVVFAARSIGAAWEEGDRESLDSEGAKRAAELVVDLSSMCVDPKSDAVSKDIGHAMRCLIDEMAHVRFSQLPCEALSEMEVMPAIGRAVEECLQIPGFCAWSVASRRSRFMYCLRRKERTEIVYTLIALLFDTGSCPLLSLPDRRMLRMQAMNFLGCGSIDSAQEMCAFFRYALARLRGMKDAGICKLDGSMSQQQLVDCISGVDTPQHIDN